MAGSTTKKVQIERFDRETLAGYVAYQTYLTGSGVEIITQAGNASVIPYADIKAVHFVRDFGDTDIRKSFMARPKTAGLWVRLSFRDGDVIEGICANDLLQIETEGVTLMPPDPNGNTQRLFVPRPALLEATVLGVIGSPLRAEPRRKKAAPGPSREQIGLFESPPNPEPDS